MRKKFIKILVTGAFALALTQAKGGTSVSAATTTDSNGVVWQYTVENGNATDVYVKNGASEALVIPSKLNTYPVTSIGGGTETTTVANNARSVEIPNTVTKINNYAFYNSYLNIDLTVDSIEIGDYAFAGSQITGISADNANIGSYAFYNCDALSKITIGKNVSSIGQYSFSECNILKSLDLEDFTGSIGQHAFSNCIGIKKLYLGSLTDFGAYAFKGCTALKDLEVNTSLRTQFQDCYNLENVVLDENVSFIYPSAFQITNAGSASDDNNGSITTAYINRFNSRTVSYIDNIIPDSSERNWYFKNSGTKLYYTSIFNSTEVGAPTCDFSDGASYCVNSTTSSMFLPATSSSLTCLRTFQHISPIGDYVYSYNYYVANDSNPTQYYNTASGYAINNIYVDCTGTTETTAIENAQESYASSVYGEMASNMINVYDLEESESSIPDYTPVEPVAINISANSSSFTHGSVLSICDLTVVVTYDDGSTEETSNFKIINPDIVAGTNEIEISLNGYDIEDTIEVTGYAYPVSFTATIKEDKYAAGTVLTTDDFTVTVTNNDGSEEEITDFFVKNATIVNGENTVVLGINGYENLTADLTVQGYVYATSIRTELVNSDKTYKDNDIITNDDINVFIVYNDGSESETEDYTIDNPKVVQGTNEISITLTDDVDIDKTAILNVAAKEKEQAASSVNTNITTTMPNTSTSTTTTVPFTNTNNTDTDTEQADSVDTGKNTDTATSTDTTTSTDSTAKKNTTTSTSAKKTTTKATTTKKATTTTSNSTAKKTATSTKTSSSSSSNKASSLSGSGSTGTTTVTYIAASGSSTGYTGVPVYTNYVDDSSAESEESAIDDEEMADEGSEAGESNSLEEADDEVMTIYESVETSGKVDDENKSDSGSKKGGFSPVFIIIILILIIGVVGFILYRRNNLNEDDNFVDEDAEIESEDNIESDDFLC